MLSHSKLSNTENKLLKNASMFVDVSIFLYVMITDLFLECGKKNEFDSHHRQEIKCNGCQGRIFYKVR